MVRPRTDTRLCANDRKWRAADVRETLDVCPVPKRKSRFGFAVVGCQRNGGFCRQQEERKCFLKVEPDRLVVMTEIADRHILSDMQSEIAAARRQDERAVNPWCPDDFAIHEALDVLQDGIAVIAGLAPAV